MGYIKQSFFTSDVKSFFLSFLSVALFILISGNTSGQCTINTVATSPLCYGGSDGKLFVTVDPACGCPLPLYYRIVNDVTLEVIELAGPINSFNYEFQNLAVGVYAIEVCATGEFIPFQTICISGGGAVFAQPPLNVTTNQENVLCNSQTSGSIELTISSPNTGYTGPFGDPCIGWNIFWTGPTPPPNGVDLDCPPELQPLASENTYSIENLLAGFYEIIVEDYNNCADTIEIEILPALSGDTLICSGATTQFTGSDLPSNDTPWQSSDELVATIDDNGLLTALSPGVTTINYTTSDGCLISQNIVIEDCTVGFDEKLLNSLVLYPNPNAGRFTFSKVLDGARVKVFSIEGKCIYNGLLTNQVDWIDISNSDSGIYILKLNHFGLEKHFHIVLK